MRMFCKAAFIAESNLMMLIYDSYCDYHRRKKASAEWRLL